MLKIKFKKKVSLEEGARSVWHSAELQRLKKIAGDDIEESFETIINLVVGLYNEHLKTAAESEQDLFIDYLKNLLNVEFRFYKSGKLYGLYLVDNNGERHGKFWEYFEDGEELLAKTGTYGPNQSKEGEWRIYKKDGNLHLSSTFKEDRAHGPSISYYEDGSIEFITSYFENMLHGILRSYNRNGELARPDIYYLNHMQVDRYEYLEHCKDNPKDPACKEPETPEEVNNAENQVQKEG